MDYYDRLVERRLLERYALVEDFGQQTPSEVLEPVSKYRQAYDDYMASARWRSRREAYYARYPRVCRACETNKNIHLHHHTYARMGHEHDDDLIPLCETCHMQVHEFHRRTDHSLTAATRIFVTKAGGEFAPSRRRATKKQKTTKTGPRPGFVDVAEVAAVLQIPVSDVPRSRQKKQRDKGYYRRGVAEQWLKNPPRWLVEVREKLIPPPPELVVGAQVQVVADAPALSWAVGATGVIIEQISDTSWVVELDGRLGSRLSVTAQMVRVC
jgi:hypothetical protein